MLFRTILSTCALLSLAVVTGCSSNRTADSLVAGETAVVHLAVDEDGSLEATAVDVEEDDDVECEQQGEHEGENEGCGEGGYADVIVGSPDQSGDALHVLGIRIEAPSASLPRTAQTHWFRGAYLGADQFQGELVKSSANQQLRILGKIASVESAGGGMVHVRIFDKTIAIDGALPLNEVQSLEAAAEADVDCEQQGEHAGENAGC